MKNRMRGEYQEACYRLGFVHDREFEVAPEPIGVTCNDNSAVARYKEARHFSSRWIANLSFAFIKLNAVLSYRSSA
jgi:hypothetical protein